VRCAAPPRARRKRAGLPPHGTVHSRPGSAIRRGDATTPCLAGSFSTWGATSWAQGAIVDVSRPRSWSETAIIAAQLHLRLVPGVCVSASSGHPGPLVRAVLVLRRATNEACCVSGRGQRLLSSLLRLVCFVAAPENIELPLRCRIHTVPATVCIVLLRIDRPLILRLTRCGYDWEKGCVETLSRRSGGSNQRNPTGRFLHKPVSKDVRKSARRKVFQATDSNDSKKKRIYGKRGHVSREKISHRCGSRGALARAGSNPRPISNIKNSRETNARELPEPKFSSCP
jgi:hypothetical protein